MIQFILEIGSQPDNQALGCSNYYIPTILPLRSGTETTGSTVLLLYKYISTNLKEFKTSLRQGQTSLT